MMHSKIDESNTHSDDSSSTSNESNYPSFTQQSNENLSLKVRIPSNSFVHVPKKRVLMFPARLYQMLQAVEQEGLDHIVSWRPHGKCFGVNNPSEFVKRILPRWFQQTKIASFQRQLNFYGFKRFSSGKDKNCYYHLLFVKGQELPASKIKRIKVKGIGTRSPSSPESEPNFYDQPLVLPSLLNCSNESSVIDRISYLARSLSRGSDGTERNASLEGQHQSLIDPNVVRLASLLMMTSRAPGVAELNIPAPTTAMLPNSVLSREQVERLLLSRLISNRNISTGTTGQGGLANVTDAFRSNNAPQFPLSGIANDASNLMSFLRSSTQATVTGATSASTLSHAFPFLNISNNGNTSITGRTEESLSSFVGIQNRMLQDQAYTNGVAGPAMERNSLQLQQLRLQSQNLNGNLSPLQTLRLLRALDLKTSVQDGGVGPDNQLHQRRI